MEITDNSKITREDNVHIQELDGEAVLLNLNNSHYYSLDKIGSHMLDALTSADNVKGAFEVLKTEYDVDPEQLHEDLMELVQSLYNSGLVKVVNE